MNQTFFQKKFRNTCVLMYPIGFAILSFGILSSCSEGNSKSVTSEEEVSVPVLELTSKSIEVPQTYVTDIQAVQFVEIRAKVEGFVDKIFVDEGQYVGKGTPLFQLSSFEFNEMVNRANARLFQAKTNVQAATLEVERLKILVEKDIITSTELELAESRLAVEKANVAEAESLLNNAKNSLSYTTIRAPFDGIVDRIPLKTGSLVTSGTLMTNITDISEVFAYYKVNENEYLSLMKKQLEQGENSLAGSELTLILSDGTVYPYKGILETMEADFEQGTGSIAFRVRFPNPDGLLKHGASGNIMMTNTLDSVFLIPQKSTFEVQDYSYVYMIDENDEVKIRSFRPLKRFDVYYVVEDFREGDRIIYEGIQLVKDGQRVNPNTITDQQAYESLLSSTL
ncbi:MAG TPA: efflux RND transporter periplasmic adaptor subunit [Cyclobacteriaceae bacterium]|nr:efflux RND transporter periplasmic adaptor subunit [Cyclobacteriaceae bacterium]